MDLETRISNLKDRLERERPGEFELIEGYIKQTLPAKFKHIPCGYEWYTRPHTLLSSEIGKGCPNCQRLSKIKTIKQFKKDIFDIKGEEYKLVKGQTYVNNRTDMKFYHKECGNTFVNTPAKMLSADISCPICREKNRNTRRKTTEIFKQELAEKHKGAYELVEGSEYTSALEKVTIVHKKCGFIWDVRASHILHTSGCPNCNDSKGELLVKSFLDGLGVEYRKEFIFDDLKNTRHLPFDFGILSAYGEVLGLIEYDGILHYKAYESRGGEKKLRQTQYNDRKKNKYCKDNNIPLQRIKYTLSDKEVESVVNSFIDKIIVEK